MALLVAGDQSDVCALEKSACVALARFMNSVEGHAQHIGIIVDKVIFLSRTKSSLTWESRLYGLLSSRENRRVLKRDA